MVAGIEEELSNFVLYPNPANRSFTVEFGERISEDAEWVLYDQSGQEVSDGALLKGVQLLEVNTEDVPSGLYFIHIYGEDRKRQSKRVIVIH